MGFWKKLCFWRRRRNVAVTTRDIATTTEDLNSENGTQVSSHYTQTPDWNEEPQKTTDGGADEKDKKIAALQKKLDTRENEIIKVIKLLQFKDGVFRRRTALRKEIKKQEEEEETRTCEASLGTANIVTHADKEIEEMKWKVAALQKTLEDKENEIIKLQKLVQFKDCAVRRRTALRKEMKKRQGTNLTRNGMKHRWDKTDGSSAEMKLRIIFEEEEDWNLASNDSRL